jgi:hypothetical protein
MLRIRSLAVLGAVIALAGCYAYRVVPLAGVAPRSRIRVTTADGRRVEVEGVSLAADSVRGFRVGQRWLWRRHRGGAQWAVAPPGGVDNS